MTDTAQRVALVTGGSRGIGRAISAHLALAGFAVAVNYQSSEEAAQQTVRMVSDAGGRAAAFRADISQAEQVDGLVTSVSETIGSPWVLVNNAGITRDNLLMRLPEEDWDAVLATDLKGAFLCIR